MLGELHQVAMIDGEHGDPLQDIAVVVNRLGKADDAAIPLALDGRLGVRRSLQLLLLAHVPASQVGDIDLVTAEPQGLGEIDFRLVGGIGRIGDIPQVVADLPFQDTDQFPAVRVDKSQLLV